MVVYAAAVLNSLTLKNFKSFREQHIEFSKTGLTVLVGKNASGKSSILDAAHAMTYAQQRDDFNALQKPEFSIRKGSSGFSLVGQYNIDSQTLHSVLNFKRESSPLLTIELIGNNGYRQTVRDHAQPLLRNPELVRTWPTPRSFDVSLRELRTPVQPRGSETDQFDAPAMIQLLLEIKLSTSATAFQSLVEEVRQVVPSMHSFGLTRVFDGVEKYGLQFDMSSGKDIDASQVSEGTLLAVALCASKLAQGRMILMIDDLDRALHPTAQREVVRVLRRAVKPGQLQVICTTHSPYLVSEFEYEEVRVLSDVDGESKCVKLTSGPDAERWMKELDAGEYWSFIEHKLFEKKSA